MRVRVLRMLHKMPSGYEVRVLTKRRRDFLKVVGVEDTHFVKFEALDSPFCLTSNIFYFSIPAQQAYCR